MYFTFLTVVCMISYVVATAPPSTTTTKANPVVDVTNENFDEFVSKQPVLLEFYAPWCKHCQQFEREYKIG